MTKNVPRDCQMSPGRQNCPWLHHWLEADFISPVYLLRIPDRKGSELCTGDSTVKRVSALLSSWSFSLVGKGSLQAFGRHWDRCCNRVLAGIRGPLDLLLWEHVNRGRTQSLLNTSCILTCRPPQRSGENEHFCLGIESYHKTGSQKHGEMKSEYKMGPRAE